MQSTETLTPSQLAHIVYSATEMVAGGRSCSPSAGPEDGCVSKGADNLMVEIEPEVYKAGNGFTARREEGLTPNGNPIARRWVLRDATGGWLDCNQYRYDLFEHNGLRPAY